MARCDQDWRLGNHLRSAIAKADIYFGFGIYEWEGYSGAAYTILHCARIVYHIDVLTDPDAGNLGSGVADGGITSYRRDWISKFG